ncbi:metabotropic glutamate receptor 3-like [Brevipalpus obovatus]|uniref:metabotropic glutamate receptor 3-like n=1 Tax=Brevipalpus obovatus TaxID=246614 RepID=UPI003D9EEC36
MQSLCKLISISGLCVLVYTLICFHGVNCDNAPPNDQIRIEGDILLGGIFPIHQKGAKPYSSTDYRSLCGALNKDRGVQRSEAMLFAIDRINNDTSLLPTIKLGAIVLDTCSSDTYAMNQSLEFIKNSVNPAFEPSAFECPDGGSVRYKNDTRNIYGVVGGSYSEVSLQVANLLRLFKIPQISYASTSVALSNKEKYEYFARTVPSDEYQAKALLHLVKFMNWTYVSLVSSESQYGESGSNEFIRNKGDSICIATHEKVPQTGNDSRFDMIIENLKKKDKARAVVVFLRMEDAKEILRAAKRANAINTFTWVAADGWGKEQKTIEGSEDVALGALTVELASQEIVQFSQYLSDKNVFTYKRNVWFPELYQEVYRCVAFSNVVVETDDLSQCSMDLPSLPELPNFQQESKIQFVIDAVYAFAHAIHRAWSEKCHPHDKVCPALRFLDPRVFYSNYLLKVDFEDLVGSHVKFDAKGDGPGRYNIFNFRKDSNGLPRYFRVGNWSEEYGSIIDLESIIWDSYGSNELPHSVCSEPCREDQIKRESGVSCCWVCQDCKSFEYKYNDSACVACDQGMWPYPNKSGCYELPQKYVRWYQPYAFIPISIAVIGIIVTLYHFVIFIKHVNTPIVKASGRELCYLLLGGILFCYIMTFVIMAKPTYTTCLIQRFGIGLCVSIIYGAILTKTNRISRIFHSARRSARRPTFISPMSQLFITGIIVIIQIALNILWCIVEKPGASLYVPEKRDEVILKCAVSKNSVLISLIYGLLLVATCTYYAFKTRKIPENFNETKFIVFTMYATCIIWIAFLAIYLSTGNNFEIQSTTLAMSVSLSGYVALICLFSPKVYIILRHPDKNVRKLTMNNATYKKGSTGPSQETPPSYSQCNTNTANTYGTCDEQLANQLDGQNGKKRLKNAKQWKKSGKDDKSKILQEEQQRSESLPLQEIKSESNTSSREMIEEQQATLEGGGGGGDDGGGGGDGDEDDEEDEAEISISRRRRDEIL